MNKLIEKINTDMPEMLWHYTKIDFYSSIKESGELRPKAEADMYKFAIRFGAVVSQAPLIWFSSNQQWEPLCFQLGAGTRSGRITWQELANEYTAIRFGINPNDSRLLNWKETCAYSSANREDRRLREKLAEKAKKFGSDATKWFASPTPIPIQELCFQIWFNGEWTDDEV